MRKLRLAFGGKVRSSSKQRDTSAKEELRSFSSHSQKTAAELTAASEPPSAFPPRSQASEQAQDTTRVGPAIASVGKSYLEGFVIGNDLWNSAFRQACAARSFEQRQKLAWTTDIVALFEELQEEDKNHEKSSVFQKGVNMIGPVLNRLNFVLNLAQPVASIEPVASSALAIAQLATLIGIAVCGAAQEMHSEIERLLKDLPLIDFCDAVEHGNQAQTHIVQKALIDAYTDLLDFFFHCYGLLQSRQYAFASAKSAMHGKISTSVASFSQNMEVLHRSIAIATKAIINRLAESEVNREIWERLETGRMNEIQHHEMLRSRADDACDWIQSNAAFKRWLQITPGAMHLEMYGDMGCGKTFTVAYVVDYLRSLPWKTNKPLVCSYFCKDDGEMNQVRNIYRSLLSQLLSLEEPLRWKFCDWYRTRQGGSQIDPTQDVEELRNLLIELIASIRQALYIVVDALDECSDNTRAELVDFFQHICESPHQSVADPDGLHRRAGLVRLFTSSRYADHSLMPNLAEAVFVQSDAQRDFRIARYLSTRYLAALAEPTRELINDEVSTKMRGSCIWARMVLEYLRTSRTTKEASIRRMLREVPQGMSELYARLFEKIVGNVPDNRWILARSLDLMAGSRRQLTLRELSYAVRIEYAPFAKAKSLAAMDEAEDYERVLDLIRPFVTIQDTSSSQVSSTVSVGLVHRSLKQLITSWSPMEWTAVPAEPRSSVGSSREAYLNSLVLQLSIDYLLLDEFGAVELVPDRTTEDFLESFAWLDVRFDDNDLEASEPPAIQEGLDPYTRGFGGFYTYAACYWTEHFSDVTPEYMPNIQDLIALSQPGSIRMKNWLDRMRQYDWRVDLERGATRGYNPLALVAWFGSKAALEELLKLEFSVLGLADEDLRKTAIKEASEQAIDYGKFYVVEVLLNHPATTSMMHETVFFSKLALRWEGLALSDVGLWSQLMELLFKKLRDVLMVYANYVLLRAARCGCLPMIKKLFEASTSDEQIRCSLLQRTDDDWGPIGQAGSFGHVQIVQYLCEQPGIGPHLHHQDPYGDNIYHVIAKNGNPEVLRALIQYFPEGVHQANGATTPLQMAVQYSRSIKAVEVLLLEGKANVNAGDPYFKPLKCAVRTAKIGMCRPLIVLGNADPWTEVGVSTMGIPFLYEQSSAPTDETFEKELLVLREICSLMPLAVSVVFLQPSTSPFQPA